MRWIRNYKEPLLIGILIMFFLSIFVGFGSYFFVNSDTRDLAAKVGASKIKNSVFQRYLNQTVGSIKAQQPNLEITPEVENQIKSSVLRDLIIRELINQEAKNWGMKVSPQEVSLFISSQEAFRREGKFIPQLYYQYLARNLGVAPKEFEGETAKDISGIKFKTFLMSTVVTTPQEADWIYSIERSTWTHVKDPEKEKQTLVAQAQSAKSMGFLNQILFQLSQKGRIQTYLKGDAAQ